MRDVVTKANAIGGFTDFSTLVSRDETRLDILASDTDPLLSEAFDENDYNVVADLAARFYSIALTDCGTGIVHSVMRATLQRADSVVIVSGGSVDEARLASETLTWLEANGYGDLVRNAVVAINTATHGTSLVKLDEIESHFASRVRDIVRIPYDPQLAAGSVVDYKHLKQTTKDAADPRRPGRRRPAVPSRRVTVRDIRLFGDPVLRSVCDPIGEPGPATEALVADLLDTVQVRAGPAWRRTRSARPAGLRVQRRRPDRLPARSRADRGAGDPVEFDEGCLSVPDLVSRRALPLGTQPRPAWTVRPSRSIGEGILAEALQHEQDHLDGMLYLPASSPTSVGRPWPRSARPLVPLTALIGRSAPSSQGQDSNGRTAGLGRVLLLRLRVEGIDVAGALLQDHVTLDAHLGVSSPDSSVKSSPSTGTRDALRAGHVRVRGVDRLLDLVADDRQLRRLRERRARRPRPCSSATRAASRCPASRARR